MSTQHFITRVTFPVFSHIALRTLGDPQLTHEVVARAHGRSDTGRVLWRTDIRREAFTLYTVAPTAPDTDVFQDVVGGEAETRPYMLPSWALSVGEKMRFKLTANPAVSVRTPEGARRLRVHTVPRYQLGWLADKAAPNGFSVDEAAVSPAGGEPAITLRRDQRKGGKSTLVRAEFNGVLTVTDSEAFANVLTSGIGRGKAFGCGLLTVHR